jgi:hypothetical protein
MKALHRRGRKLGIFSAKKESHRRGKFDILNDALTMGPGQRVRLLFFYPRFQGLNFVSTNTRPYRRLLHHFLKSKAARRIIGFQSSASISPITFSRSGADTFQVVLRGIFQSYGSTWHIRWRVFKKISLRSAVHLKILYTLLSALTLVQYRHI